MKKLISVIILLCGISYITFSARPSTQKKTEKTTASPVVEQQQYPIITKDGVKFIYEGKAKSVKVKGSFSNWSEIPLKLEKENLWSATIEVPVGKHQYGFVVDGKYILDPKNPRKITTSDGYINSYFEFVPKGLSGPVQTKDGVKFCYYAPKAKEVYIAGDFNNWADNESGVVTNKEHLLQKDKDGVWTKTLKISPGVYKYKFVVDGNNWVKDPLGEDANDEYDNSLIKVLPQGVEFLGARVTPAGVEFAYYAPDAKEVYVAGDFNNWANNKAGVVSDKQHLMQKSKDGVWRKTIKLQPGEYKYKYVIDGTSWTADPFGTPANDEYGNSLIIVK
ncbi:MAG: glycogen-binding domain-containing protein [Endomicrobia bacterium]|nr:glycogen-binding domain-containing protein [Endomicrobiia bacterium]